MSGVASPSIRAVVQPVASSVVGDVAGGGATFLTDWYLIAEGDSITASESPSSYARLVVGLFDDEPGLSVPAIAGTNQTAMEARFTDSVEDIITAELDREMVILSTLMGNGCIELTTDLLYTRLKAYWLQVRSAGAKVLACTFLPRNNGGIAPGWSDGDPPSAVNILQKSDPSLYDELCDFSAETYGQVAAASDTDLYSDGVHPTASLHDLMAVTYRSALVRLISSNRPENTVQPTITGTLESGQTITCSNGTWTQGTSFSYQWFRGTSAISGATSQSYVLTPADVDSVVKCNVKCTNGGIGVWVASEYTATIGASYGSELLTNGTFDANITGWPAANSGILTWDSRQLKIESPGSVSSPGARPSWTAEVGQYYRLTFDVTLGVGSQPFRALIANSAFSFLVWRDMTASGSSSLVFQAPNTDMRLWVRGEGTPAAGSTWFVDNVSIKKIL